MSRFLPKSFFGVFALAAALVGLTSCEKSSGTIGIGFADDSQLSFGSLKEVSIASWTEDFDSLITLMPNALMVGSYDDPVFGRPSVSFGAQVILRSVAPRFGQNATLDSAIMILPYSGWYGDTSAAFTVRVNRSAAPLTDSIYYGFSALSPGFLLCDTTFSPDAVLKTLKSGARVGKAALALRLDPARLEQWIIDEAQARP
ncbi:MAG: DUF4270 domain-containing protein, partial [Cryomorphaceae bacterium]|nr:DUF4270 domain-containing protein [Cryomorphaceae bacterium]